MIPKPKFDVGDTVWVSDTMDTKHQEQCPDCLGTGKWLGTMPTGEQFDIHCQTCYGGYGSSGRVTVHAHDVRVHKMTVGSVRINTGEREHPVEYMMNETGVGSGTIWYEERVHATPEEAEAHARTVLLPQWLETMAGHEARNREYKRKEARRAYKSYAIDDIRKACIKHSAPEVYEDLTGYKLGEAMRAKKKKGAA